MLAKGEFVDSSIVLSVTASDVYQLVKGEDIMFLKNKPQRKVGTFLILLAFTLAACNLPASGGTGGGSIPPDPCSVDYLIVSIDYATANGPGTPCTP